MLASDIALKYLILPKKYYLFSKSDMQTDEVLHLLDESKHFKYLCQKIVFAIHNSLKTVKD